MGSHAADVAVVMGDVVSTQAERMLNESALLGDKNIRIYVYIHQ
jgi:hypothetical protein